MSNWKIVKDQLPPMGVVVDTKVDDAAGIRNEQELKLSSGWEVQMVVPKKTYDQPAFNAAELGVMLPCESGMKFFESYYNDHLGSWVCEFRGFKTSEENEEWDFSKPPPKIHETEADTEAEARADMIIWLLENESVTAEEINNLLKD